MIRNKHLVGKDDLKVCVTFNFLSAIDHCFDKLLHNRIHAAKITRASAKVTDEQCTDDEGLDLV